jgi:hypothetical protein
MTVPADKTYPVTATNKAWQKKKSFIDKAKANTKTGLGAALLTAEARWNAIPWKDLDASAQTVVSVESAQRNLAKAKSTLIKLNAAKKALLVAKSKAMTTKTNKALSKPAQLAAGNIDLALGQASKRLDKITLVDFEDAIEKAQKAALVNMTKVNVYDGRNVVMTGGAATWDRKVLKVSGVAWKVGKADDYKGKTLTVRGETTGSSQWAEGISKVFANDMKLQSASGNAATFIP